MSTVTTHNGTGMAGSAKAHDDGIKAFSETDQTDEVISPDLLAFVKG